MKKTGLAQIELTRNKDDRDPHTKKQQMAVGAKFFKERDLSKKIGVAYRQAVQLQRLVRDLNE